jgi:hypothetical protein
MTIINSDIKEAYIAKLNSSALILFDLSMMTATYSEDQCNVWLLKGNAAAELLKRSVAEFFKPDYDETVKKATEKLGATQKMLEEELKVQQDTAATIAAVADMLSIAESILIIFAGARLRITVGSISLLTKST